MKSLHLCVGTLVALLCSTTFATPTVVVGNKVLAPNFAGQTVRLSVTGGDQVQAIDLNAEIADGGTAAGDMSATGPAFTAANLVTGTIFASNNSGQQDLSSFSQSPQIYSGAVVTNTGTVSASGLLAVLTIDTTGFSTPNTAFPLRLKGFSNGNFSGDSDFVSNVSEDVILPSNITNGNLIIGYPGDLNLDGAVNFNDLLSLAQNYGHTGATYAQGDINHDGAVNFNDLLTLAQNYGNSVNTGIAPPAVAFAASSVPEPSSLGAALTILATCALRRRVAR
jgi:hypothetical protein